MKRYPTYKDSCVDWIGEIPIHWDASLLKRYVTHIKDGTHGSYSRVENGYPLLSAKNVYNEEIKIDEVESYISYEDFCEITYNGFPSQGDLLITCVGTIGRTFVYNLGYSTAFQRSVSFLRFNGTSYNQFYKYFIQSDFYLNYLISVAKTSAQSAVYMGDLAKSTVLNPPIYEQIKIATFLDHKILHIDELITKKQRLIELLQEERTALINQFVTKGLDPTVPMKDSGIEWLGEIPKHWEVIRLKFLANAVKTGNTPPSEREEYYENPDIDWFTPSDFDGRLYLKDSQRKINAKAIEDGMAKLFAPLSVLIIGIGATLGKIGIIKKVASSNQQINSIEFSIQMNPIFAAYFLKVFESVIKNMSNAATLAILNQTNTKNLLLACPPRKEQDRIAFFIEEENSKVELTISKINKEIELISEYKTSLINEAVIGKIDVRDYNLTNA